MENSIEKCNICGSKLKHYSYTDEYGECEYGYKCNNCSYSYEFHYGEYEINYFNKVDVSNLVFSKSTKELIIIILKEFDKILKIGFPYDGEIYILKGFLRNIKLSLKKAKEKQLSQEKLSKLEDIINTDVSADNIKDYREQLFIEKIQLYQIFFDLKEYIIS